jgi:hypothetical protein
MATCAHCGKEIAGAPVTFTVGGVATSYHPGHAPATVAPGATCEPRVGTPGLQGEFTERFRKLLDAPESPSPRDVAAFRAWVLKNFFWDRTPKGGKREKDDVDRFWRGMAWAEHGGAVPGAFARMYGGQAGSAVLEALPRWVELFTAEGKRTTILRERTLGENTYVNMVGASDARLNDMIATLEDVFASLHGWRKKAIAGGIKVVFAGPKDFRGTASGRYHRADDALWIRATPGGRIEKGGSRYGGLAYVIVHELGHRYEMRHRPPVDFDQSEWITTRYSTTEGEAFAELFALSNFGMTEYGADKVAAFEKVMAGS